MAAVTPRISLSTEELALRANRGTVGSPPTHYARSENSGFLRRPEYDLFEVAPEPAEWVRETSHGPAAEWRVSHPGCRTAPAASWFGDASPQLSVALPARGYADLGLAGSAAAD
jgi:hypothetical protein